MAFQCHGRQKNFYSSEKKDPEHQLLCSKIKDIARISSCSPCGYISTMNVSQIESKVSRRHDYSMRRAVFWFGWFVGFGWFD